MSQNVSNQLPIYTVQHPRRVKIPFTQQQKPEIMHGINNYHAMKAKNSHT
jgi:hypothetical protein